MCYGEWQDITVVDVHPGGLVLTLAAFRGAVQLRVVAWRDLTVSREDDGGALVLTWPGGEGIYPLRFARVDKHARYGWSDDQHREYDTRIAREYDERAAEAGRMFDAVMAAWHKWALDQVDGPARPNYSESPKGCG